MTSIEAGPHYEVRSAELADWLEQQGADQWWNVDGDPLLTGRLSFPCPADELAAELRKINRTLLVHVPNDEGEAKGQSIGAAKLGRIARKLGSLPRWANDRFFYLCWEGSPHEWLLAEDSDTAKQMSEEGASKSS